MKCEDYGGLREPPVRQTQGGHREALYNCRIQMRSLLSVLVKLWHLVASAI